MSTERDRRSAASRKRLAKLQADYDAIYVKLNRLAAAIEAEKKHLAWVMSMPVPDQPEPDQPEEGDR